MSSERTAWCIIAGQAWILLLAIASFAWLDTGHHVPATGWVIIGALEAFMQIAAQQVIRLLRKEIRECRRALSQGPYGS